MRAPRFVSGLIQLARSRWLGPHFYYDLIRLARKGWPTLARVLYLVALLVSLTVMYRLQGDNVNFRQPSEYARRAEGYAYTLIILQNILVLALLPVYVASAVAEEKENLTLEALTLTHLTDRELVLGKLGARLMHLGAVVLSGLPILAFMHLWGNVDSMLLVYHETNTLLLLLSAGSVCIWVSTHSESVFQAISGSYPWLALLGFFGVIGVLMAPWICGATLRPATLIGGEPTPHYLAVLPLVVIGHLVLTFLMLRAAIVQMEYLRLQERRSPRKTTGALALTDDQPAPPSRPGKRGQVRSRIHPWAWPIHEDALFWKECVKDGTSWSLSYRWVLVALAILPLIAIGFRLLPSKPNEPGVKVLAYSFGFSAYFVGLAAYALVVLFQMTMSVAGEREQKTLTFLLLVPSERRAILWAKWLGPWWRNWPILAISYFGVVLALGSGMFGFGTALYLLLLPWPLFLMLSCLALLLSVLCRRVLFANIALVGVLSVLFIAHVAVGNVTWLVLSFHTAVIGEVAWAKISKDVSLAEAAALALGEQAVFLLIAGLCMLLAFQRFGTKDFVDS